MINYIFLSIIIFSLLYGISTDNVMSLNKTILETPKNALKLMADFSAMIIFWNGILGVAKEGGFLKFLTKYIKKIIKPLFKEVPKDSPALDYIAANVAANTLGLGNAATPLGLKAMKELQKINKEKDKASKEMITLMILNTAGFTIMPTTILAIRKSFNAKITVELIPVIIILSFLTTIIGLIINFLYARKCKI